jgi:transcriptional regulator with XRE-family HTH domain
MSTNPEVVRAPDVNSEVGARIHQMMFRKRVSQTKFAPSVGMSQSLLSKKLRGVVPWSVVELLLVANALGVDPGELLPKVDPKVEEPPIPGLPRMDSNHQPFAYVSSQVAGGSVVPLFAPGDPRWTHDPQRATRPRTGRPFGPVRVRSGHLVAV